MKVGIMQPYFVPYIGYWQLMNAVDVYVIYDDVNFINRGWIHRNRILINGQIKYFNLPMLGASQNKLIMEIEVNNAPKLINQNIRMIELSYRKAPYFSKVYELLKECLYCGKGNVADYIENSFCVINEYLGIGTRLVRSSKLDKDCSLKGSQKILDICKLLHADEYYNAIGGMGLYSYEDFRKENIVLKFLKTSDIVYKQFGKEFYPNLSIVDVMMFNAPMEIREMLEKYTLVEE